MGHAMGRGPNVTQRTNTGKCFQAAAVESGESTFDMFDSVGERCEDNTPFAGDDHGADQRDPKASACTHRDRNNNGRVSTVGDRNLYHRVGSELDPEQQLTTCTC